MDNCNVTVLPMNNTTGNDEDIKVYDDYSFKDYILSIFIVLITIFGMSGNGMVIWLLGFRIKRNPFTTFVLNLAIADFGVLTTEVLFRTYVFLELSGKRPFALLALSICLSSPTFCASQCILTVISVDRCVSVFFPLWHRCHRPRYLSATICTIIWGVSLIPPTVGFSHSIPQYVEGVLILQLLVNACLCLPVMTISSLMLFFKVCYKSKQQRKQKALVPVLLTAFVFLVLSIPVYVLIITDKSQVSIVIYYLGPNEYATFCGLLNSSVNPLIYYLFGRAKRGCSKKSMEAALQKLFKEEESQTYVVEKSSSNSTVITS